MASKTNRHNDNRMRNASEVKQMLRDIAFVLHMTRRVKKEIVDVVPSARLTSNSNEGNSTPAYAA